MKTKTAVVPNRSQTAQTSFSRDAGRRSPTTCSSCSCCYERAYRSLWLEAPPGQRRRLEQSEESGSRSGRPLLGAPLVDRLLRDLEVEGLAGLEQRLHAGQDHGPTAPDLVAHRLGEAAVCHA